MRQEKIVLFQNFTTIFYIKEQVVIIVAKSPLSPDLQDIHSKQDATKSVGEQNFQAGVGSHIEKNYLKTENSNDFSQENKGKAPQELDELHKDDYLAKYEEARFDFRNDDEIDETIVSNYETLWVEYSASNEYDPCNPHFVDDNTTHPADRAEILESLSLEKQLCMLTHMDTEDAAETIAELEGTHVRDLMENLDADDAARILSAMDPDDAADVLDEVDEDHRDVLLSNLSPEDADHLRALLSFDPDTAAGVMNTEIIIIDETENIDEAILHIRQELEDKEMPYYVYVVDHLDVLVGILSLRELMLAKPGTIIQELCDKNSLITVEYDLDKLEVARLISHYNFLALPVVDKEGHLLGAVTHDDVIDIIQEEASSDLLGMMGAGQSEDIYTPWLQSVKMRLPWLFINMLNSTLSAYIVYLFQGSIAQMAFLAVIMPMVANQAGNTGQQALAVMIRQLATDKFDKKKLWKAVFRELQIGFLTGIIISAVVALVLWLITDNIILGAVMAIALLLDMLLGSVAGGSIPLILRSLGRDPAQASSIFLTAITDGAGFFIFLSIATFFLL